MAVGTTANQHWWPNQLNLNILHQNSPLSDPMGKDFNYAEEFKTLDLDALKKDICGTNIPRLPTKNGERLFIYN